MSQTQDGRTLPRLAEIMERLLAPNGCPWDREQTLASLRSYVLEEAHEVAEAIDGGRPEDLCEELGDLLLQIVFQAALAQRMGWFGLDDVVAAICGKMVRRHPHVFGDESASDAGAVVTRWEEIKKAEKGPRGLLDGIPAQLPALLTAYKIGQRAARVGLDFPNAAQARAKVVEEMAELDQALLVGDDAAAQRELGDLLFSLVNWSRMLGLDPEAGLRGAVTRFRLRVEEVERLANAEGQSLSQMDEDAVDALWQRAKRDFEEQP